MNTNKTEKKIVSAAGKAIKDFNMIKNNDHLMVCLSGGKDSWTLLKILQILQKKAPIKFKITAVNIDPNFQGYQNNKIAEYCEKNKIDLQVIKTEIKEIITEKQRPGSSFCAFCARLRRGAIYTTAEKLKATKIALGHHADDLIETLLLNMFFTGQLKSMAPIMRTDDQKHIVIRPLLYVQEKQIIEYTRQEKFPLIDCPCPKENKIEQRQEIKKLIKKLAKNIPDIRTNIMRSMKKVIKSHLLDNSIWDFEKI